MRTLSGTLTTAQQGTGQKPFVKVILTHPTGSPAYTFKTTDAANRVWRVDSPENVWGGSDRTFLYLQNSDQNFSALDLRGYRADVYWGYVTGAGEESSLQAPIWVYNQEDHSEEGILMTKLECVDIWWRLSKLKVVGGGTKLSGTIVGTFQHGEVVTGGTTGFTARVLTIGVGHIVVVGANGTFVAPEVVTGFTSGATITLTGVTSGGVGASPSWEGDTTILNILRSLTYQVADLVDDTAAADARISDMPFYTTNRFDSMLGIIRRMIEMTNSQLIFKADGDLHLVYLAAAPATDYSYDGSHAFLVDVRSRVLTIPNKVFVVDQLPDSEEVEGDPQFTYFGVANDTLSQDAIGVVTQVVEAPGVTSNAEAAYRAQTLLNRIKEETVKGFVKVPVNCGQEIADWVSITDSRAGITVAGRVAKIARSYNPREVREQHYTMEVNIGGLLDAVDISSPQSLLDSLITYGYGRYSIPGGAISGPISGGGMVVDADLVSYTPAVLADWNAGADPGDVDDALDQVAERVEDLEAAPPAHNILSAVHGDTLVGSVLDGDVVIGNVTPKWSKLAITVPAANIRNLLGVDNGELRPSWKALLDGTNPADTGTAAPGTALTAAHRDHVHNLEVHGAAKHTDRTRVLWIPAHQFGIASGSPDLALRGSAGAYNNIFAWAFDGAAAEYITATADLPTDWDNGAVTVILYWAPSTADAGNVVWQAIVGYLVNNTQIDRAYDAIVEATIATPGVAEQMTESTMPTFTPTTSRMRLCIARDGTAAGDTYNALDAWLVGIQINYTADM